MSELERVQSGEWFEIRERIHHPESLLDYFVSRRLPSDSPSGMVQQLRVAADALIEAIEDGVYEYRRHEIVAVCNNLSDAEYSSTVFSHLHEYVDRLSIVMLVSVVHRLLVSGEIPFLGADTEKDADADGPEENQAREAADIHAIIGDVKEILAADPEAKMNAAMKNIVVQVQKYRNEAQTFKKLKAQASGHRLEMYSKTFAATFQEIFQSIRRNYHAYLVEQAAGDAGIETRSPFTGLDTHDVLRTMMGHLETLSALRATIIYADNEDTGMREPLIRAGSQRGSLLEDIDEEYAALEELLEQSDAAYRASRVVAREIAARLARWADKLGATL